MKRRIGAICLVLCMMTSMYPVAAATAPYELPDDTDEQVEESATDGSDEDDVLKLTAKSAVTYGLKNSTILDSLDNKIDVAISKDEYIDETVEALEDAEETLSDYNSELSSSSKAVKVAQYDLDAAYTALAAGYAPSDIPLTDTSGNEIVDATGEQIVIPSGTYISSFLTTYLGLSDDEATAMTALITASVEVTLDAMQDEIDESEVAIEEASETLSASWVEYGEALTELSEELVDELDLSFDVSYDTDSAVDLVVTMGDVSLDVTRYAKEIYRNQIAMLIRSNYYDALYARKELELKTRALERGEKQYELVKLSYENGMKAKDDFLLARMYYDGTVIEKTLAQATYDTAILELKESMCMDQEQEVYLVDIFAPNVSHEDLEVGLKSGMTKRVEIQKDLGNLMIYELNAEAVNYLYRYQEDSYEVEEANLALETAEIQLESDKITVESEIRQSYDLMVATGEMVEQSYRLISDAEQVVAIAQLKYEQGFGSSNALLADLNLESSSGTIVELIAAQEKLAEVESLVANINYKYTMAKVKYYNDAGILKD